MSVRPLDGLMVVDLTQVVSGAVTTMMLADFGAEVFKIEPPGGEPYRKFGYPLSGPGGETNLNILRFTRGKKSVELDLKSEDGQETLAGLLEQADVLVENFRPGVLDKLGFSADRLEELNPRLVYTSISGYGHDDLYDSPYKERPAYAIITEALAGITHLAGDGEGPPVWLGFAMADIYAGTLALTGTLLALEERRITGRGRRVDIGMFDGAVFMNDLAVAYRSLLDQDMGGGQYLLQSPWGPFATEDGYVVVAVLNLKEWQSLCDVLERPDLRDHPELQTGVDRSRHHEELVCPAVDAWTAVRTRDQAVSELLAGGVPAAPVNSAGDLLADPQVAARRMLEQVHTPELGSVQLVGNPIKVAGHALDDARRRIAALGEHTEEARNRARSGS